MSPDQLWTQEEDDLLVELRSKGVFMSELYKHMPGRTFAACKARARHLGIVRFYEGTPESSEFTRASCDALRDATIRAMLNYANENSIDIDEAASRLLSGDLAKNRQKVNDPVDNDNSCEVNAVKRHEEAA